MAPAAFVPPARRLAALPLASMQAVSGHSCGRDVHIRKMRFVARARRSAPVVAARRTTAPSPAPRSLRRRDGGPGVEAFTADRRGAPAEDALPPSKASGYGRADGQKKGGGWRRGKQQGRPKQGNKRRAPNGNNSERKNWKHVVPCSEEELCSMFSTDARMIAAYIGNGGVLSEKVLTSIRPNVWNLALRWQVDVRVAQSALQALVDASVANEHSLAAFFSLCASSPYPHAAATFWRSLDSDCVYKQLSLISGNALLSAACLARNPSLPLDLMDEMTASGCFLNRVSYNMLLDHYAKVRDLDGALYLFRQMRAAASAPGHRTVDFDISPDCFTYSALVKAVVSSRRFELLYDVHQLVLDSDGAADAHLWSSLAAAYAKDHNFEEALRILQKLQAEEPGAAKQLLSGYNSVLSVMGRLGMFEEAWEIYLERLAGTEAGLRGDNVTFVCLLNAAYRSRCQTEATIESLHREMLSVCGSYTVQLLTALLNCYRSALDLSNQQRLSKVDEMYSFICDIGMQPTTTTHNSVMTAHLDCGDADGVVQHFHSMQDRGAALDKISFKIIIQAYDLLDMPDKAEEMKMLQESMDLIKGQQYR